MSPLDKQYNLFEQEQSSSIIDDKKLILKLGDRFRSDSGIIYHIISQYGKSLDFKALWEGTDGDVGITVIHYNGSSIDVERSDALFAALGVSEFVDKLCAFCDTWLIPGIHVCEECENA